MAVIVPTDAKALIAPMKQLAGMGTKIVTVDQTLSDPSFVQTQIVTDNEQGGKLAADAMNALLGGKGKVLVITQPPGSAAQDARTTGFEEELKKYSGHCSISGRSTRATTRRRRPRSSPRPSRRIPDLAGLFSTNDQGAIGALTGLRQAGATGKVKVVAYDAATAEVNAFKNGGISSLIAQNPKQEGEVAMEVRGQADQGTVARQDYADRNRDHQGGRYGGGDQVRIQGRLPVGRGPWRCGAVHD